MDKINEILSNKTYKKILLEIEELEKGREFCKHNLIHFLDMARIAYIICLEKNLSYTKDVIYAISLLHDIGRGEQYKNNIPHDEAGIKIAKEILKETSYTLEERKLILKGIDSHRNKDNDNEFLSIIYRADKISRNCFDCKAEKDCYWSSEKKNMIIKY